nr:D-TA family PLP-dependent enzyme [Pedobacter panaciterrae]
MAEQDWYVIDNVNELDSPALVFYPDRIADNITKLKGSIDSISRLRPHVKTHKSIDVTLLMMKAGISKFKCATIAEADMLAACTAPDVLLAYQPVGPKIRRFLALVDRFPLTRFSCLVDNEQSLNELSNAAAELDLEVNLFLDLNIGMNRTGILPDERALALYQKMNDSKHLKAVGLHAYDGHIHDVSLSERREKWKIGWDLIQKLKESIVGKGLPVPVIVGGGTPTYPFYAEQAEVECSPGTFILWDTGYQRSFEEQKYAIAAVLITRVVSLLDETKLCVDLGHKAVAAENELTKRVSFISAPEARIISQSEEHLVLEMPKGHGFKIGDVLYALPIHICPTVALYERAAILKNHRITAEWGITSRNRRINI